MRQIKRFFPGEPLPENFLSPLVAAELTITWDRDDVWIGLVDADEKKRCEDVPSNFFTPGMGCDGTSTNFVAGDSGAIASEGFTWEMEPGRTTLLLGQKMEHCLLGLKSLSPTKFTLGIHC